MKFKGMRFINHNNFFKIYTDRSVFQVQVSSFMNNFDIAGVSPQGNLRRSFPSSKGLNDRRIVSHLTGKLDPVKSRVYRHRRRLFAV